MYSETTRLSLLSRVRDQSDQCAWQEFEARYRGLVVRYCRARGLQPADAEDIRQIVLINLSKALPGFQYDPARGRFRDYLCRVVRNAIYRHIVRPNLAATALDTSATTAISAEDAAESDALWEQEWIDHHYRLAMRTIRTSFDQRSTEIFDRLLAGESTEAVATAFSTSTQAVHKIKQRIRDRLRELVAAQIQEEDEPDGPRAEG